MTITVRGSNIAFISGTPGSISLPAGSAAGDFAVLFAEGGWPVLAVAGWHNIDNEQGSNINGAAYGKVLDSADVSSGSVSVPFGGGFAGILAIIVFVGSTVALRTFVGSRNSSGAASRSLTTDTSPQINDYAIYFGSTRDNFAVTSSSGTSLKTSSNANASGVLAGNLLAGAGAVSSTFTYSGTGSGDYQIIVIVRAAAAPITTFSSAQKTNTTLSGYDLIATSTGAGGVCSSRFLQGKTYFEMTPTTLVGTPSVGIAAASWNTSTALQSAVNSLGYLASGAVQVNGTTLSTIATWAQGNRIDCAIDPANHLIWFRVAGGNWNNDVIANQNPAGDVGGIDYSSAFTQLGTLEAAVYASATGNVWTAVFSAASFAGTPPAGYSSLDAVIYTVANNVDIAYEVEPAVVPTFATPIARAVPHPLDNYQHLFSPAGTITNVSGTTKENGVVVTGKRVEVYDRTTGELLGWTVSDGSGNWAIPCLGRPAVRVVGSDPTTYNSIVYDNVVPV